MTDLSDFARPPKKPPRAGKSTFGQTNGLHPLVERKILMIKSYYKQRNKENEKKTEKWSGETESGTREALEASELFCSARRFQNFQSSNQNVSFCSSMRGCINLNWGH